MNSRNKLIILISLLLIVIIVIILLFALKNKSEIIINNDEARINLENSKKITISYLSEKKILSDEKKQTLLDSLNNHNYKIIDEPRFNSFKWFSNRF